MLLKNSENYFSNAKEVEEDEIQRIIIEERITSAVKSGQNVYLTGEQESYKAINTVEIEQLLQLRGIETKQMDAQETFILFLIEFILAVIAGFSFEAKMVKGQKLAKTKNIP